MFVMIAIALLAVGMSVLAVRGALPSLILALSVASLALLLVGFVCGIIYGLVHSRGSELILPAALAVLLAVSLVLVLRSLRVPPAARPGDPAIPR
jgi:hypothetical protein